MEEDDEKVQKKINLLNREYPPAAWDSVVGFHGSNAIRVEANGTHTPVGNKGLTVKNFINTKTKEIRSFYFEEFIKKD